MGKKSKSIKCKNCGHVVELREYPPFGGDKPEWSHKSMLHDDGCNCRKPEPNFKPIQKIIEEAMKEVDEDMKKHPLRFDNSRGWNSLSVEEMFRPFTI